MDWDERALYSYIKLAFGTPRHRSLPFRCVAVGRQLDISIAAASGAVSAAAVSAKACPDPLLAACQQHLGFPNMSGCSVKNLPKY